MIEKKKLSRPENFQLQANYNDPFLVGRIIDTIKTTEIQQPVLEKIINTKPQVFWPSIKYLGFVRNVDSRVPRALLVIDKMIFKLQVGDFILDDLHLIKANREYATIKYNKEIKEFRKN